MRRFVHENQDNKNLLTRERKSIKWGTIEQLQTAIDEVLSLSGEYSWFLRYCVKNSICLILKETPDK